MLKNNIPGWMWKEVAQYDLDMVPPPATILDIGANVGAFSLRYAAKWPKAQIRAFEPVRANFEALRENLTGYHNIIPWQMALRATQGVQPIFIGDQPATCGFFQRGRQTQITEVVKCLDVSGIEGAELVKIDTEGCEVEILQNLDLQDTRALVVEYHSAADRVTIKSLLAERGYNLLAHIPGSHEHGVLKFGRDAGVTNPVAASVPGAADQQVSPTQPRKIYVAIAGHYANNDVSFVQSLIGLVLRTTVSLQFGWSCDPSVERARNILTANFLESQCTHLLFVDADIGFSPEDVAQICSHDELVVGGLYPLKNLNPEVQWCGNGLGPSAPVREDGLSQVKYIGTGFLCIARQAFEHILIHDGEAITYRQDFPPHRREYAFWRQGVSQDRFLTEDWMFCQRWLELGGVIYADSRVMLRHAGRAEWPLPFQRGNPFAPTAPSTIPATPETA